MKKQYDALFTACIGKIDYSELAALLENMETAHVKEYFEAKIIHSFNL
ncbi:MAG: hypothetical protein ACRY3E_04230 [Candidatus Lariskella arthropodorum]